MPGIQNLVTDPYEEFKNEFIYMYIYEGLTKPCEDVLIIYERDGTLTSTAIHKNMAKNFSYSDL